MSRQREADDFVGHNALSETAKEKSCLPVMAHIRWNDRDKVAYYLKKRSDPSASHFEGNFSLDKETLEELAAAQRRGDIKRTYIVLVERYNAVTAVASDTLLEVLKRLSRVKPHVGANGNEFWWVYSDLQPMGKVEYTDAAPF